VGNLPPVGSLFAAFLGENPVKLLLAPTGELARLPARNVAVLTGRDFFPQLISQPFHHGLVIVFATAMALLVIAAAASLMRGGRYIHEDQPQDAPQTAGGQPADGARAGQDGTDAPLPAARNDGAPSRWAVRAGGRRTNPDA
jgi:hypothetical protein